MLAQDNTSSLFHAINLSFTSIMSSSFSTLKGVRIASSKLVGVLLACSNREYFHTRSNFFHLPTYLLGVRFERH